MISVFREIYRNFSQLLIWWVIVSPWDQIVRVRLGKYIRIFGAGIHLRIPFVDTIYRQTIRRRVVATPVQTISTRDQKVITIAGQISYCIEDLGKLYMTLHHAQGVLSAEAQSYVAEYVISHRIEDCTPERVQEFVRDSIDFSKYGVGSVKFFITNFATTRTHRFITGNIESWADGDHLITDQADRRAGNGMNPQ